MLFSEDTFKMGVYINCYAEKSDRERARLIYFSQNKKQKSLSLFSIRKEIA